MTDEVTTAATATEQQPAQAVQVDPTAAPSVEPVAGMTVEEVEAKRNAENLERAKAAGYVEPAEPSIAERVNALVDGVQRAMDHNAPISREHLEEMKALLGHRDQAAG